MQKNFTKYLHVFLSVVVVVVFVFCPDSFGRMKKKEENDVEKPLLTMAFSPNSMVRVWLAKIESWIFPP